MRELCYDCRDRLFEGRQSLQLVGPTRPVLIYMDGKFQYEVDEIDVINRREVFAINIKTGGV